MSKVCRHCFDADHKYVCTCGHHHTDHIFSGGCRLCKHCERYDQRKQLEPIELEVVVDPIEG